MSTACAETDERRNNRLKRMRDHEHERRAAETSEQREDRLQHTRLKNDARQL